MLSTPEIFLAPLKAEGSRVWGGFMRGLPYTNTFFFSTYLSCLPALSLCTLKHCLHVNVLVRMCTPRHCLDVNALEKDAEVSSCM